MFKYFFSGSYLSRPGANTGGGGFFNLYISKLQKLNICFHLVESEGSVVVELGKGQPAQVSAYLITFREAV